MAEDCGKLYNILKTFLKQQKSMQGPEWTSLVRLVLFKLR